MFKEELLKDLKYQLLNARKDITINLSIKPDSHKKWQCLSKPKVAIANSLW